MLAPLRTVTTTRYAEGGSLPGLMEDRTHPFAYAILRVVPSGERGECLNVGVVVFCRELDFLDLRTDVDERRLFDALVAATEREDATLAHRVAEPWVQRIRSLEHEHVEALEEHLRIHRALAA